MGVRRPGEIDSDLSAVTEDDLSCLDEVGNAMASTKTTNAIDKGNQEPAALSGEDLGHLAPGCFVQFGTDGMSCWIEINRIEGDIIGGKLHQELSNPICLIEHYFTDVVSIRRDQITAMGCDRYCWC